MPIEPPEIPPATPGQPTEPPPENPPGNPRPEVPPPLREPGRTTTAAGIAGQDAGRVPDTRAERPEHSQSRHRSGEDRMNAQ